MTISHYHDRASAPIRPTGFMTFLMLVNVIVAMTVLFAWTAISLYIVEPIAWATWMPVRRGTSFEELFEYPFVMLWLMPLAGNAGAWLGLKFGRRNFALACLILPVALLGLIFGWYYGAPPELR